MTATELQWHLNKGHRVIPIGHCPDFDYQTGCPGHDQAKTESGVGDVPE